MRRGPLSNGKPPVAASASPMKDCPADAHPVATLLLVLINGLWLFRLAALEATFRTPHGLPFGEWSASIPVNPLRLLGVNLVCIPGLLTVFLIVRANGW